jgi:biotin carboxyl carrier protein
MPGLVLNVLVSDGQSVAKGDAVLVLEAMKMENIIKAPADGVVKKVAVVKGDKVEKNQVMISMG